MQKLRVFADLDVIAAGCATTRSYYSASRAVLIAVAIGLIEGIITPDMLATLQNVLTLKFQNRLPTAVQVFRDLVEGYFVVVPDPTFEQVQPFLGQVTDPDDAPILAAASLSGCRALVTFNTRHYRQAKGIAVMRPETLMTLMRHAIAKYVIIVMSGFRMPKAGVVELGIVEVTFYGTVRCRDCSRRICFLRPICSYHINQRHCLPQRSQRSH